jgi:parallel beta-helix repeat protein
MTAPGPVTRAGGPTLTVGTGGPSAYPTIGDALSAAPDGATVIVAPGTYGEALFINGVSTTIIASDADGATVIDATPLPMPALSANGGTVEVRGITIRSGDAPVVAVNNGRLRMRDCELSSRSDTGVLATNRAQVELHHVRVHSGQHGFVIDDSGGTIIDCEVTDVTGDGVIVRQGADPIIRDCTVHNCGDRGFYIYQYGRPTLEGCTVIDVGAAGIAAVHDSRPTIRRCRVERSRGPGIAFGPGCVGLVEECSFAQVGVVEIDVASGAGPVVRLADPATGRATRRATGQATGREAVRADNDDDVDRLLDSLDEMVGLAGVKDDVRSLIDEIQVNEWRRASGLNVGNVNHHLVFAGPPGTGKTTVARLYGRLLAALEVLPKGGFVEVTRQDLVVGYFGHTAPKTTEVFTSALGGVLFIDEAYTLSRTVGTGRDFGLEAIDTLVKLMEDHRGQIVVIAAGYTDEMRDFLAANPGLASRFPRTIEFDSYSAADLVEISRRIAVAADYALDPPLDAALRRHFDGVERGPTFANAREARTLVDLMRRAQARRLRRAGGRASLTDLRTLVEADYHDAVSRVPAVRRPAGP